jgi:hypothetical protein
MLGVHNDGLQLRNVQRLNAGEVETSSHKLQTIPWHDSARGDGRR